MRTERSDACAVPEKRDLFQGALRVWRSVVAVLLLAGLHGCGGGEPASTQARNPEDLRIVSFVPAATRVMVDLGLGGRLVGVAEHDAAAPETNADGDAMPIVGSFMDVDTERLLTLAPTHVVFPQTGSGVPEALRAMAEDAGFALVVEPYPTSVEDVLEAVPRLAFAVGASAAGETLLESVQVAIQKHVQFRHVVSHRQVEFGETGGGGRLPGSELRVLLAFGVDPVVASGPGSVNDGLLGILGATNAVADASVSAVTLDREALVACSPDVVLLLLPGGSETEAASKVAWLDGLPIPAVTDGRVVALTDPEVLLPSTNLPSVLEAMSDAVHRVAEEPPAAIESVGSEPGGVGW